MKVKDLIKHLQSLENQEAEIRIDPTNIPSYIGPGARYYIAGARVIDLSPDGFPESYALTVPKW